MRVAMYAVAMAAYAVAAHISHARPHRPGPFRTFDAAVTHVDARQPDAVPEDLTAALVWDSNGDRPSKVLASWSETTFFLFDPESWR
jgi:hypothetical protein